MTKDSNRGWVGKVAHTLRAQISIRLAESATRPGRIARTRIAVAASGSPRQTHGTRFSRCGSEVYIDSFLGSVICRLSESVLPRTAARFDPSNCSKSQRCTSSQG